MDASFARCPVVDLLTHGSSRVMHALTTMPILVTLVLVVVAVSLVLPVLFMIMTIKHALFSKRASQHAPQHNSPRFFGLFPVVDEAEFCMGSISLESFAYVLCVCMATNAIAHTLRAERWFIDEFGSDVIQTCDDENWQDRIASATVQLVLAVAVPIAVRLRRASVLHGYTGALLVIGMRRIVLKVLEQFTLEKRWPSLQFTMVLGDLMALFNTAHVVYSLARRCEVHDESRRYSSVDTAEAFNDLNDGDDDVELHDLTDDKWQPAKMDVISG